MSHELAQRYPGLVVLALLATAVTCAVTLVLYRRGTLRLGGRGRRVVVLAAWAYAGYLLVNLALMLSGVGASPLERGWLDVLVGVLAVGLAALNLVADFESIQIASDRGAPATAAWTAAFGPLVTIVWMPSAVPPLTCHSCPTVARNGEAVSRARSSGRRGRASGW